MKFKSGDKIICKRHIKFSSQFPERISFFNSKVFPGAVFEVIGYAGHCSVGSMIYIQIFLDCMTAVWEADFELLKSVEEKQKEKENKSLWDELAELE